jgi:hypothetical protein
MTQPSGSDRNFKKFSESSTRPRRALQIWLILMSKAHNRQTLTYGMLADMMGFQGAGTLAPILGYVMCYCQQQNLPPLTVLVVNQSTGLPGAGLEGDHLHEAREEVFRYNWFDLEPPTPEALTIAKQNHP